MSGLAETAVASPCIGVCQLDAGDICAGCGRSLQDIAEWSAATEARRREIVERAKQRVKPVLIKDMQAS